MESRNSYENKIDEISSLSESKEHPIDIQEKKDAFVNEFKGVLFDKNTRSSELLFNFYECCYKFLPRAQPQDKIDSYNSALQAFSIFCSSTLTHNNIGFDGNDSNLLIVFYVQIMPDDFVMQLHRF